MQVVLQEVDQYVEVVAEAEASPEVRQEVEEVLAIEDEGVLGGEAEEEASVLREGVEGVIQISPGLALVGEDHSRLALRQKASFLWENTQ